MTLKPTKVPLTAKDFDEERWGYCFGCGCFCGYLAYFKGSEFVDLYGHPADPNGVGSFCTKGITLIQGLSKNPLRILEPLKEVKEPPRDGSKVGIFLDRVTTDLVDMLSALEYSPHVYSDALALDFKASTLKPQEWRDQKVILALECEPVFSEVMFTRWLVDAFEKGSFIVSVSSRYATTSAKASKRLLLNPRKVVEFLIQLSDAVSGKVKKGDWEEINLLAEAFKTVPQSCILVGETILRSPWRDQVFGALASIRKVVRVNYSIVGDVSPVKTKGLKEFLEEINDLDFLILTGNPARFMDDQKAEILKSKESLYLGLFPDISANLCKGVLPVKAFWEREFWGYRSLQRVPQRSPAVCKPPKSAVSLKEIIPSKAEPQEVDLWEEKPFVEDLSFPEEPLEEGKLYILAENYLTDHLGHWHPWTHGMEREQKVYINPETARKLGLEKKLEIRGTELPLEITPNVAPDTFYIPSSFEEFQPFDPGVRVGRLLSEPWLRVCTFS